MNLRRLMNTFCQLNLPLANDKLKVPAFMVNPSNISVIKTPDDFYNSLKDLALQSKKRIVLSSLYLGTGHLEKDLINCLSESRSKSRDLDLTILLDYNRATREVFDSNKKESVSSKFCLLPLVRDGANVSFYLTPNFSGWRRWIQRKQKWNELSSLHHMKLYLFDDNLIISGANLSDLYFTHRQDRYVLIRDSPQLCDYFDQLIKTVSRFSMALDQNGQFALHSNWKYDPRRYFQQLKFRKTARQEIRKLNEKFCTQNIDLNRDLALVFPLLQMKSIGIDDEEQFTSSFIQNLPKDSQLHMATGYFNLTKSYQKIMLNSPNGSSKSMLMASEEANGFYNGGGILALCTVARRPTSPYTFGRVERRADPHA